MKGPVTAILLVLITITVFAQIREIDSLESLLKRSIVNDTTKINFYNNLAYDYANIGQIASLFAFEFVFTVDG